MYIQITTRCNMRCAHCCFNCTARGMDMGRDTFIEAARLAEDSGEYITIGGGEPTVHPLFWDFLGLSQLYVFENEVVPHVITNGKKTRDALRLAEAAQRGVISAELSRDDYHELVDPQVVAAFSRHKSGDCSSGIRVVTHILPFGRAKKNNVYTERNGCVCDDLFVKPDGSLWACAHFEEQFGTIFHPDVPDWYRDQSSQCSKKRTRELEPEAA